MNADPKQGLKGPKGSQRSDRSVSNSEKSYLTLTADSLLVTSTGKIEIHLTKLVWSKLACWKTTVFGNFICFSAFD